MRAEWSRQAVRHRGGVGSTERVTVRHLCCQPNRWRGRGPYSRSDDPFGVRLPTDQFPASRPRSLRIIRKTADLANDGASPKLVRQDLKRISNFDDADVPGLLRGQRRLRRHVGPLTFLVQRPREARSEPPQVVHSRVGSLGVENSAPRSDPADPCDPAAIRSPFVCGAGSLTAGIYDEGVFGCFGIGRISRIVSGTRQDASATSRDPVLT